VENVFFKKQANTVSSSGSEIRVFSDFETLLFYNKDAEDLFLRCAERTASVVRVSGRGPGFDSRRYQIFPEKYWVWNEVHSAS
jgi:hypothetical protein